MVEIHKRAPRNKTLTISEEERATLLKSIVRKIDNHNASSLLNIIVNDIFQNIVPFIADKSVDLLILDPPYNLNKAFNQACFSKKTVQEYSIYLENIFQSFAPKLKETASLYICGDWYSSISIFDVASQFFNVRNRITWEREKGRSAKRNWKNCSEDIWFCTVGNEYSFNMEEVRLRKFVIAPYKEAGKPKDWFETSGQKKFRDTASSNFMSDITIPFWSMGENTQHPTQKSEKLIAKLILASSNVGDVVCDPFLGSGTTAVVCKKLNRNFIAIEQDIEYCLWAQKRLKQAAKDTIIQGYKDGVFWERNSLVQQKKRK